MNDDMKYFTWHVHSIN